MVRVVFPCSVIGVNPSVVEFTEGFQTKEQDSSYRAADHQR